VGDKLNINNMCPKKYMMYYADTVKISIITVCYNCDKFIEKTISSVINQTYPNIEYIIIDGGSTDNSHKIIEKYLKNIHLFISEEDNGIYDAMNKGIKNSTGNIIYFLNSGDYLVNNYVIENVMKVWNSNTEYNIIYGDIIYYGNFFKKNLNMHRKTKIDLLLNGICHQAVFIKREDYINSNGFNPKYSLFADRELLLKLSILLKKRFLHISEPIAYYQAGGVSDIQSEKYYKEKIAVIKKYCLNKQILMESLKNPFSGIMLIITLIYLRVFLTIDLAIGYIKKC
jgi:glycosyltransferase involved in cell wall biosynthesis